MNKRIISLLVGIVVVAVGVFIYSVATAQPAPPEQTAGEKEFQRVFVDACVTEASTQLDSGDSHNYCTCAYNELKTNAGGWTKLPNYTDTISQEQLLEQAAPCFVHIGKIK